MTTTTKSEIKKEMSQAARALFVDNNIYELRALGVPSGNGFTRNYAGWYNDTEKLIEAAAYYDNLKPKYVSVTINPVDPDLLARSANRMKALQKGDATTTDSNIIRRLWLPIDVDPNRPAGISATEEEKQSSLETAFQIMSDLNDIGWPEPIIADSGNGSHVLYRIDLPNDFESEKLVKNCLLALAEKYNNDGSEIDTSLANASRILKFYGTMSRKGDSIETRPHRRSALINNPSELNVVDSNLLEALAATAPKPIIPTYEHNSDHSSNTGSLSVFDRARLYLEKCEPAIEGQQGDQATFKAACVLVNDFNLSEGDALNLMMEWNLRCSPPWEEHQLRLKIRGARQYAKQAPGNKAESKLPERQFEKSSGKSSGKTKQQPLPVIPEGAKNLRDIYNQAKDTDMGNAERLIEGAFGKIKFSASRGWCAWEGRYWIPGKAKVHQMYMDHVRERIYKEASIAQANKDNFLSRALFKWAKKSEGARVRESCLQVAQSYPEVTLSDSDIDSDPFLFCCDNATIDLRTGEAREHDPADLITKISPVKYVEGAKCPQWEQFLRDIFDNDQDLIDYLQIALGYSITASTREQCFFILYGSGKNGKSVFMNTINSLMGTYAMETPPETLMRDRNSTNRPTNDVARLAGARCVSANETEEGQMLAESKIKALTGDDTITARYLHKEFFEFKPQFKIWIRTNHKPRIRGTDEGIWRRVHLIPFLVKIAEEKQDRDLGKKLEAELPGILNWAITGCLAWQNVGLVPPESVAAATDDYKNSQDLIGLFLAERCVVSPDKVTGYVKLSDLYTEYQDWCDEAGERPSSKRNLSFRLVERGFTKRKAFAEWVWVWDGIKLINEKPKTKYQQPSWFGN